MNTPAEDKSAAVHCAEFVRTHDFARYASALFVPAQARRALLALYAFNAEICRVHTQVSQPGPLSNGTTVAVPHSEIAVQQSDSRMFVFDAGVNLDEIVRAVNNVGAAPGDLVAILEALQQAGALHAQLVVI